jgi:hypothetical protein
MLENDIGDELLERGSVSTSDRGRNWYALASSTARRNAPSARRNPWKYPAAWNRCVGMTSTRSSVGIVNPFTARSGR